MYLLVCDVNKKTILCLKLFIPVIMPTNHSLGLIQHIIRQQLLTTKQAKFRQAKQI